MWVWFKDGRPSDATAVVFVLAVACKASTKEAKKRMLRQLAWRRRSERLGRASAKRR